MSLSQINLRDTRGFVSVNGNLAEKSGVGKPSAPVPAEHAGRLADVGEARHSVAGTAYGTFLVCLFNKTGRGVQDHL